MRQTEQEALEALQCAAEGVIEQVPQARPCCILAPAILPFSSDDNLVDPSSLGTHHGSNKARGLVYSGASGFFDLGHMRDLCDLTKYIYDEIVSAKGSPITIQTTHGEVAFNSSLPKNEWISIARSIAFEDSLGYEIITYTTMSPRGHNSSFSPEDLCSNYLGTLLAEKAINRGGSFNNSVSSELRTMITSLGGQTKANSLKAFNLINNRWVNFSGVSSLLSNTYLTRRNFTRSPWKTGHLSDKSTPRWVTGGFGTISIQYAYKNTIGRTIPQTNCQAEISTIRTNGKATYGAYYDKP